MLLFYTSCRETDNFRKRMLFTDQIRIRSTKMVVRDVVVVVNDVDAAA